MVRSVHGSSRGWALLKSKAKKRKKPPKKIHECYERRNSALSVIGYRNYQEYLASDDWKKLKTGILQSNPVCLLCEHPSQVVHHTSYSMGTLLGLGNHRLVWLCYRCHTTIEMDGDRKRNLRQANRELFRLAEQSERGRSWIKEIKVHRERDAEEFRAKAKYKAEQKKQRKAKKQKGRAK